MSYKRVSNKSKISLLTLLTLAGVASTNSEAKAQSTSGNYASPSVYINSTDNNRLAGEKDTVVITQHGEFIESMTEDGEPNVFITSTDGSFESQLTGNGFGGFAEVGDSLVFEHIGNGFDNLRSFGYLNDNGDFVPGEFKTINVSESLSSLPVEFSDVGAEVVGKSIVVSRTTAQEQNNAFFEVQKFEGGEFVSIGDVLPTSPNSSVSQEYSFEDDQPNNGENLYRIRQVDLDGTVSYSDITSVEYGVEAGSLTFTVYPNPTTDLVNINIPGQLSNDTYVRVLDTNGRTIADSNNGQVNIANQPAGTYVVQAKVNGKLVAKQVIKN